MSVCRDGDHPIVLAEIPLGDDLIRKLYKTLPRIAIAPGAPNRSQNFWGWLPRALR
jgi:hypothetical protein